MTDNPIKLTVGKDTQGRMIAIADTWDEARGRVVLTLEVVKDEAEAQSWFENALIERPWETRQ